MKKNAELFSSDSSDSEEKFPQLSVAHSSLSQKRHTSSKMESNFNHSNNLDDSTQVNRSGFQNSISPRFRTVMSLESDSDSCDEILRQGFTKFTPKRKGSVDSDGSDDERQKSWAWHLKKVLPTERERQTETRKPRTFRHPAGSALSTVPVTCLPSEKKEEYGNFSLQENELVGFQSRSQREELSVPRLGTADACRHHEKVFNRP